MMVVLRGRVKVCTHSEDGKELVLNLFSPGDVFGEIALLDGADRTADAVTSTTASCWCSSGATSCRSCAAIRTPA